MSKFLVISPSPVTVIFVPLGVNIGAAELYIIKNHKIIVGQCRLHFYDQFSVTFEWQI